MTPCVRLHGVPGSHIPPCTCTQDCVEAIGHGHCLGCRPVEATHGLLCTRCSRQGRDNLGASEGLDPDNPVHGLPWAWEHLWSAYPSLSQAPGKGGSSVDDPEAERLSAVVSLRADIHDVLADWVEAVAEKTGLAGPDTSRTAELKHVLSFDDGAVDHHGGNGLLGPSWQRFRVRRRAAWLLTQIESLESHEAVAEAWQELSDLMHRAHSLAPWRPAPTKLDGSLCRCGATSALHDHGDEIRCWACQRPYTREEYRVMSTVFGRRYADDPRAVDADRPRLATVEDPVSAEASFGGRV